MVAVAGRIPIGEHKRLPITVPLVFEALSIIVNFVEEGDKMDRMALGATTTVIVSIHRVRNMGLVIIGVHVLSIPAGGELQK